MRIFFKYIILLIFTLLIFTSCGPGTEEGLGFETVDEFKNNFKDFCAFPTYIPFEFNKIENVYISCGATYNDKGFEERRSFIYNPEKKYNRIDIFNSLSLAYNKILYDKDNDNDNEIDFDSDNYVLRKVICSMLPDFTQHDADMLDVIKHNEFTIYYEEYIESELVDSSKTYLKGENILNLLYYMNFDGAFYQFLFIYNISKDVDKETLLSLRDEFKAICLEESIKAYESLKYED